MAPRPARQQAEWVKDRVEQLKTRNQAEALKHCRVNCPWGFYRIVDSGSRYQSHAHLRARRAALVAEALPPLQALGGGARVAEVTIGEEVRLYHENES
jgi:hypothetical protein